MSLGLPSTNNQTTVTGVASLFSTLGKGQAGAEKSGLDWASTLRQTATQQREFLERSRQGVADKTTTRGAELVKDRAAERTTERPVDRAAGGTADRSKDAADRQARGLSRADGRADAIDGRIKNRADQREDTSVDNTGAVTVKDEGASSFTDQDVAADETVHDDTQAAAQAQDPTTDEDDVDQTPVDELTLEAAGAQAIAQVVVDAVSQASAQVSQNAKAQAVESQGVAAGNAQQQVDANASQLQSTAQAASNQAATLATQVAAGQNKSEGQGDGKAALPAQAANAAAAQAQQNPAINAVAADGQSTSQQQGQHDPQHSSGQSGQPGQQNQTTHVQTSQPAAVGSQHAAIALDIQTTAGGSSANGHATAGGVTTAPAGQGATPNVMTLPAGADPLMQSQDDADPNVTRIAQGLRSAVNLKGGAVTIRLNPHELGSVRIEMEIKNGNVRAQLQTGNASVRDLLNHQLGKLRETLQGRGLHVERLEVNSPAPADGSSAGRNAQESPDQGRSRGQFFGQRGGSGSQSGSGSQQQDQNLSDIKAFGDMLVDMVG